MSKLTLEQKAEVRAHLLNGTMSDEDLQNNYLISQRQVQYYRKEMGINRNRGAHLKGKNVLLPENNDQVKNLYDEENENIDDSDQEEIKPPIEENLFLNKEELFHTSPNQFKFHDPMNPESQSEKEEEVILCKNCDEKGNRGVLKEGWENCPYCGVSLQW